MTAEIAGYVVYYWEEGKFGLAPGHPSGWRPVPGAQFFRTAEDAEKRARNYAKAKANGVITRISEVYK